MKDEELKIERQKFQMHSKGYKDIADAIKEAKEPEVNEIGENVTMVISGRRGPQGKPGEKPTEKELIALIEPRLPTEDKLKSIIIPLIPKPIKGEDGKSIRGPQGKPGKTPIKGIDYNDGKDGYTPKKGKDYFDGQPGRPGKDITEVDADKLVEKLQGVRKQWLSIDAIDGDFNRRIKQIVHTGGATGVTEAPIDGKTYVRKDANWLEQTDIANGDVVGPVSATDGNIPLFDTTTGKKIKDSGKKISDFAPALGSDENYVTDAEKADLHAPHSDDQDLTDLVIGPETNTDKFIPQWNGTDSKTLENGLELTTTVPSSTSTDSQIPSAKSIYDCAETKATQFSGICSETPISASDISIDYTTRILTINRTGGFHYFTDGNGIITKHIIPGSISFPAFTDTSGIWNFYFDNNGEPQVSQGTQPDYNLVAMVYRILWNATLTGSEKAVVEAWEAHENTSPAIDHTWKHKFGTIWASGGDMASNALPSGTPNADGRNAVVALSTLKNLDDNLLYTITNSAVVAQWNQDLGNTTPASLNATNSALFKIRLQDAGGLTSYINATRFPFAFNASNTPEFITSVGTRTNVTAGNYFVYYLYSIQDPRSGEAIKSVSAPVQFNTLTLAQASSWADLQALYTTLNDGEIRPLYRLIYQYQSGYDVGTKKAVIREVQDIRVQRVTSTVASGSILATAVVNTPAGSISSTNVQDAINELDTEKASLTGTETLTNKRVNPRIVSAASYTTDTGTSLSIATCDEFVVTAQAGALKLNNPGGTPVEGNRIIVRIKDNGTARALTYDTQFRAMGVALPSTTVVSKTMYMGFIYNATDTKWDLVAVAKEA